MTAAHERVSAASEVMIVSSLTWARFSGVRRITAVALASSRELLRERILYILTGFALLLIGTALLLGELSVGQERRIVLDVGLGAIRVLGIAMAIVLGVRLLEREIERRTIYVLLTKPVRRWEVLLGKLLGGALLLFASVVVMTGGLTLTLTAMGRPWKEELPLLIPVVFLLWLQFLMAMALALLFSTFSTSALSMLSALGLVLIGHASREFLQWAEVVRSPLLALLCRALYYVLPNMQNLNLTAAVVHGREVVPSIIGMASAYVGLYLVVVFVLAAIVFHWREFR